MTIRLSRRAATLLSALALGAAGLMPVTMQGATAAPAAPPACQDFTAGYGTYDETPGTSVDGQALRGRFTWTAMVGDRTCLDSFYEVSFQRPDGSLLKKERRVGTGAEAVQLVDGTTAYTVTYTVDLDASGDGCVGIEGGTYNAKGTLVDDAPDGAARSSTPTMVYCPDSSGGQAWF